jgi:hypothetical protein
LFCNVDTEKLGDLKPAQNIKNSATRILFPRQ